MDPTQVFLVLTGIITLSITLFVYRGRKDAVRQSFLLTGVGASCWTISLVLMQVTRDFSFAYPTLFGGFLAFGGLFLLAKTFPDNMDAMPRRFYFYLAPVLILTILLPFKILIRDAIFHLDESIEPILGPAFPLFIITAFGYIVASLFLMVEKFRHATGIIKVQMQYLFLGLFVSFFIAFIADIFLPALGIYQFNVLGAFSPIAFTASTAYAIVRHRFLDIQIIIQRGLLYSIAIGIVAAIYLAIIFAIGELFRQGIEGASLISGLIAAIIAVLGFPRFKDFFQRASDPFFFKGTYNYSEVVRELNHAFSSSIDSEQLITSLDGILQKALKVETIVYLARLPNGTLQIVSKKSPTRQPDLSKKFQDSVVRLLETNREIVVYQELDYYIKRISHTDSQVRDLKNVKDFLEKRKISVVVPIFSKDHLVSIMLLGEKLSGDAFSARDIELLNTFSYQAGVASENIRLYEEIKAHSGQLEKKVRERTRDLTNLYETQMQLIQDLSHALQTPLAIVKSAVDAELKARMPKDDRKNIRSLEQICASMSEIIRRILILARSETEAEAFERASVPLPELLQDLGEQMAILAEDQGLHFRMEIRDHMRVLGDRERLRELFTELLSNALKYTPRGGIIRMTLRKVENAIWVVIADTGYGIPKKDLPHIFQRFYRVKRNGEQVGDGIGLGLAIAESIAKAHGGKITVESVLGKGSTFTVRLPLLGKEK